MDETDCAVSHQRYGQGGMKMAKEEIAKVLRMALALEKKNYEDYRKNAQEAELQSFRKMFEFLAEEEERHIEMIREKMKQYGVSEEEE
ncbi:MAG: hypothetical protein D6713_07360 [Deltaproteobacteria bacterium]|nr:MAG: hypothetical protein D6713_07360 [Deltaproteobacteria bacterium]